ncbi:recombinase family protein [Spirillospora sp. CA-255316]
MGHAPRTGQASQAPISLEVLRAGTRGSSRGRLTGLGPGHRPPGPLRLAFAGRVSTEDQQDPTLSIPRQLNNCRAVLPEHAVIAAHFYDIESGRKDLASRGRGQGHERFVIPVPREGGIQDLLTEAERPDRRFDAVICESIDRIARRTYIGTLIENRLEEAGVLLLAADEPINLDGKRASQILTRRVKQGVSEWYVLELLEKSWGGFEAHTAQGFNIGKPPYGYIAKKIPHPVSARRAEGASKHLLQPDPVRGPVVTTIFSWRVDECLGYQAIADRLNTDLDRYPPPRPVDPARSVGRWTHSSVREILVNPKHTGYMVWNRRATKRDGGKHNPPEAWVWSPAPTHEPLVSVEIFTAAQQVARRRERSRSASGLNTCPGTTRSYILRSYLVCTDCGRRMFGRNNRVGTAYYICKPPKGYVPEGHPPSYWIREDLLLKGLNDYFNRDVFGEHRRSRLSALFTDAETQAANEHQAAVEAIRKTINDLTQRRERLIASLEHVEVPDPEFTRDVNARAAHLSAERDEKKTKLAELENARPTRQCPTLLDEIPAGSIDLGRVPEATLRKLFEAFRLEMRYDRKTNKVRCQVTVTPEVIPAQRKAVKDALEDEKPVHDGDRARVCGVPPAGHTQHLRRHDQDMWPSGRGGTDSPGTVGKRAGREDVDL